MTGWWRTTDTEATSKSRETALGTLEIMAGATDTVMESAQDTPRTAEWVLDFLKCCKADGLTICEIDDLIVGIAEHLQHEEMERAADRQREGGVCMRWAAICGKMAFLLRKSANTTDINVRWNQG